jgi:hypothetical protein
MTLATALTRLDAAIGRLEDTSVQLLKELVGRRLAVGADDVDSPAILRDPRVQAAGIRLSDVRLDPEPVDGDGGAAVPVEVDAQAAFVALAEQRGSYNLAAQRHPEAWAAARAAADLDGSSGPDGDDPNLEVARLVEQAMADYGLTASEASCAVMQERPDLWHRTRGVST